MATILYRLTKQRPTSAEYFNYKITISITRYHYNHRKDIKQKIGLIKTIVYRDSGRIFLRENGRRVLT